MRFEGRQRADLFDRCWSIYLWLTDSFPLERISFTILRVKSFWSFSISSG